MTHKPLVSVIIPAYNAKQFLERCFSSLLSEKGDFEVIFVDDGSTDGSSDFVKEKFPDQRLKILALTHNVGAAQARNLGVGQSQGEYLFFLDADTEIKTGWFLELTAFFEKRPLTGLAQAKILRLGTDNFDYAGDFFGPLGFLVERAQGRRDTGQFDQSHLVFGIKTAAAFMSRYVFQTIGGFDPDYRYLCEDTDISWRTWLAGYEVFFCPRITVWHAFGSSEKPQGFYEERRKIYDSVYLGCRNTILNLLKNLGLKKLVFILPLNIGCWLIIGLTFLLKLNFREALAVFKGVTWNFVFLSQTLKKRRLIQAKRKITDQKLFSLVGSSRPIPYYLGKYLSYVYKRPF